jgi:recombination protein RecR
MYPPPLQHLIDLFARFPGIGPRQAARFAFFLLKDRQTANDLSEAIARAVSRLASCSQCFRSIERRENQNGTLCAFCASPKRDPSSIAVVEKESDLLNLEKTGAFGGMYHVLGGVVSPLESSSIGHLHLKELYQRVRARLEKEKKPFELVLATNSTTEGDMTALYIERIMEPLKNTHPHFRISRLGRGLSLGAELEYADEITLKNALNNRR